MYRCNVAAAKIPDMKNLIDVQVNGLINYKIYDLNAGGFEVVSTNYLTTPTIIKTESAITYDDAFAKTM